MLNQPIAQTFVCDEDGGMFVTSAEVFFRTKDSSLPVTMEIRDTVNGYPGFNVIPFGTVVKNPSDINISTDAQTATKFTFESPVYLEFGSEYCLCLTANSPNYVMWIARLGDTENQSLSTSGTSATNTLSAKRQVTKQPVVGMLFKSQNATAWAPSMMEDLKFNLYRAEFSTTAATVNLTNDVVPVRTLDENPLRFLDGSAVIQVLHRDHGMYSTSNNVTIASVKSGASTTLNGAITKDSTSITLTSGTNFDDTSGKYSRDASSVYYIKIDDEIITYTTISTNSITSATRGVNDTTAAAHADGATVELYMLYKIPFTEINKTHTAISNIGIDDYTITVTSSAVIDSTSSTVTAAGGTLVTATENNPYAVAQYNVASMQQSGTNIVSSTRPTTATSPAGSETSFTKTTSANAITVNLNENVFFDKMYMISSGINETNEMSSVKSLDLDLTLSTTKTNLSPVVDMGRSSVYAITNRLNNVDSSSDVYPTSAFAARTEPDGDNNAAIYITKRVLLENQATAIRLLFDAVTSNDSEIQPYYKILRTDDTSDFDELGWVSFGTAINDASVPDDTQGQFIEHQYNAGIKDDGIGTSLDAFTSFAIKIVMQSTNAADVPQIKDLRALALAT